MTWGGDTLDWVGLIRVDNALYRWLGQPIQDGKGCCRGLHNYLGFPLKGSLKGSIRDL